MVFIMRQLKEQLVMYCPQLALSDSLAARRLYHGICLLVGWLLVFVVHARCQ
jgi:hypothetical protein